MLLDKHELRVGRETLRRWMLAEGRGAVTHAATNISPTAPAARELPKSFIVSEPQHALKRFDRARSDTLYLRTLTSASTPRFCDFGSHSDRARSDKGDVRAVRCRFTLPTHRNSSHRNVISCSPACHTGLRLYLHPRVTADAVIMSGQLQANPREGTIPLRRPR